MGFLIYTTIVVVFAIGYVYLIMRYLHAWNDMPIAPPKSRMEENEIQEFISVVIPARDEAANITACIQSVLKQNYKKGAFEIIVVDDHSEDLTADKVAAFTEENVRLVKLSEVATSDHEVAYKKRAIEVGVEMSNGDVIVTTDADCSHHPNWLRSVSKAFNSTSNGGADIVSGPVLFNYGKSVFQKFQALDFIGMIGITAASLHLGMFNLANGANLAFRKKIFKDIGGYSGIDNTASGDDMLLIYKFAHRDPARVRFLKSDNAAVYTQPAKDLAEFVQQRLRWTSKSFDYQDWRITAILAFVYLANVLLLFNVLAAILLLSLPFLKIFMIQALLMFTVDFIFLRSVTGFFNRRDLLGSFIPSQLLHIIYIVVIGLLGNIIPYRWKGRKLK